MLTPEMKALRDWAMEKMACCQGIPYPVGFTDSEKDEWDFQLGAKESAFLDVIMKIDGSDEILKEEIRKRVIEFYHETMAAAYRLREAQCGSAREASMGNPCPQTAEVL